MSYDHKTIEKKWQNRWEAEGAFVVNSEVKAKKKKYILDMFPYPSGAGLHVGHPEGYTATDIYSRYLRMQGFSVLHPMGWDAFGLPAENYAIKSGIHPQESTEENIKIFTRQIKSLGFSYDWSREVNTSSPNYYKWTQWLFLQLYKAGLAYKKAAPVNWCPSCQTVLANEQVVDGKCERCGHEVEQKNLEQWFFKITGQNPRGESNPTVEEVLLATNNSSKVERFKNLLTLSGSNIAVKTPKDLGIKAIEVEEGSDLLENARNKARAYLGKSVLPIIGTDTGLFVKNEVIDPAKVRRNALAEFDEAKLSQEEIAQKVIAYYQSIANKYGGEVEAYWKDIMVIIFPDGKEESAEAIRPIILTNKPPVKLDLNMPIRGMYRSLVTNKYAHEETEEDLKKEMAVVTKALMQLLQPVPGSYPERLLNNLDKLDWPEPIKTMQRNWIGRSEGAEIEFRVEGVLNRHPERSDSGVEGSSGFNTETLRQAQGDVSIRVFTTRPDTLYGATYLVLSPEHSLVQELKDQITNWMEVETYIKEASSKSQIERTDLGKQKTGVELKGVKAVNPANKEEVSVWVADYVLVTYGTGAIMAVPAHDERDFEFAKKFNLPIKKVIMPPELVHFSRSATDLAMGVPESLRVESDCYAGTGTMTNSQEFDDMESEEAKWKITEKVGGKKTIQYKLRDWLISRQRYWGAPIPIIYCDDCGEQAVPEKDLPVELPTDVDFRPKGESPLARSKTFHQVKCPKCGQAARRESDTMDTFVDSSWYFLRYTDPKNDKEFASKDKINAWLPVNTYVGGAEHAVLHLMYARFITMALHDLGYVDFDEPFLQLRNQGLILGPDGQKMSKSRGNVINPDEVVEKFGADTMRMYEMFMGPLEDSKPWSTDGIVGVRRFLDRVWEMQKLQMSKSKIQTNVKIKNPKNTVERELHKLIKKVGGDIESFDFNTAVSQMMIFVNTVYKAGEISQEHLKSFLKTLSPFAPHLANELWEKLGHKKLIEHEAWPEYDESLLVEDEVIYIVQINGKLRAQISAAPEAGEEAIAALAKADEKATAYLTGKEIVKQIFVPGKLINFVIK